MNLSKLFSYNSFSSLSIWEKILLSISSIIFTYLFIENFVFSDSFEIASFRGIDDTAFQTTLRSIHLAIASFKLEKLLRLNDYGYGWIFWIINTLISLPFYLLTLLSDKSEFLLIAIPRQVGLIFTFATFFIIYKILSLYSKDSFVKLFAILFLFICPTLITYSLQFTSIPQVMFFSSLSLYFTLKFQDRICDKKHLKIIAISFAACCGTKLNGLFISPLIALLILDGMQWKINKDRLWLLVYFGSIFILYFILFANPSLFLAPFNHNYIFEYYDSIKYSISQSRKSLGITLSFADSLKKGFIESYYSIYSWAAILILFLIKIYFDFRSNFEKSRRDTFYILALFLLVTSYLAATIKISPGYISQYFVVIGYLVVFPFLIIEKFSKIKYCLMPLILVLSIATNHQAISQEYNHYFDLEKSPTVQSKISIQNEMRQIVGKIEDYPNQEINALMDYRAVFAYSSFRKGMNLVYSFSNSNTVMNRFERGFDFIVLSKSSSSFQTEEEFIKVTSNADPEIAKNILETKMIEQELVKSGIFNNSKYQLVLDRDGILLYKRISNKVFSKK